MPIYRKILAPLDGSDLSERALQPAATLAQALGAQLLVLRVTPSVELLVNEEVHQDLRRTAQGYLDDVTRRTVAGRVELSVLVRQGQPAPTIAQVARAEEVDLIVMSSHGRSGVGRWVYGSVAEHILRADGCDVLIIRAAAALPNLRGGRLLVTLDGSALAEQALEPGAALAEALSAELNLLRLTFSISHLEPQFYQRIFHHMEIEERRQGQAYLNGLKQRLAGRPFAVRAEALIGDAATGIVDYARARSIDLILIASHGRSGVQRWLYGSVAEKVLQGANCATLIVRQRGGAAPIPIDMAVTIAPA